MKTYLFDLDGTLVDSMPTFASVMMRILDENNVKYDSDIVEVITPLGYKGTAEYFVKLGMDIPINKIIEKMNAYSQKEYAESIPAKKNVAKILAELKRRGVSLNVLTASPHVMLDCCLKRLNLFDLFDNVWSCDDFNTTKANPEIYKMVADKLGVSVTDVLFFDDNINAIKTAKLAGARVFGVYDHSSKNAVREMEEVSEKYIIDFDQILDI